MEFLYPQPTASDLTELYSESYYNAWGLRDPAMADSIRTMKLATFRLQLDLIRRFVPAGAILDVGCATGFFLEAAQEEEFLPYGVEISRFSAAIAQERFGADRVFQGTLEECPFPAGSFDVITMSDLLEHVRDPMAVLRAAERLLKDDGVLMIMTPATDSLTHRLMGQRWVHYKLEHLFYFSRRSLVALAARAGFRIVHCAPAPKYMNLAYFYHQFAIYPHWLITPVTRLLKAVLPEELLSADFRVTIGERVAILKKDTQQDR